MSYEVIKKRGDNYYRYLQTSYREGGKVKTKSVYLGPVTPKRRRFSIGAFIMGALSIGMHVAEHGTKRPSYKTKNRLPDPRSLRGIYQRAQATAGMYREELTTDQQAHRDAWNKLVSLMSDEEWATHVSRVKAQKGSETAQNAPGRTEAPPAKNFTVDDEIDAREAKFHATQEEVNAWRGYETLSEPAPMDGPLSEPDANVPSEHSQPDAPSPDVAVE